MTQPLFIQPDAAFEKISAEVDLSEDPNQWPHEVLQELYKQVPYIADFEPSIEMQRVDSERGYGIGQVVIANRSEAQAGADPSMMQAAGIRSVRIPLVIKERKLSPFDLLVNDTAKVLPLTESRLRTALFRPQAFDVTSQTPGDQSMIGTLYPPYRQNYGFGGGGVTVGATMGKSASAEDLTSYLLGGQTPGTTKYASARKEAAKEKGLKRLGQLLSGEHLRELRADPRYESGVKNYFKNRPGARVVDKEGKHLGNLTSEQAARLRKPVVDAAEESMKVLGTRAAGAGALVTAGAAYGAKKEKKASALEEELMEEKTAISKLHLHGIALPAAANASRSRLRQVSAKMRAKGTPKALELADVVEKEMKRRPTDPVGQLNESITEGYRRLGRTGAGKAVKRIGSQLSKLLPDSKYASALEEELIAELESRDPGFRQVVPFKKTASLMRATFSGYNSSDINGFFDKLAADESLQAAYSANRNAVLDSLSLLANYEPVSLEKRASALASTISPTVVQLTKTASGYHVKSASNTYWRTSEEDLSRRDALARFGEKVVLAADEAGQVTMMQGEGVSEEAPLDKPVPESISSSGVYKVTVEATGQELIGVAVPNLLDTDGQPLPLVLFSNGSHSAAQPDMLGVPAGTSASLPTGAPGGAGVFFSHTAEGKLQATIPLLLSGSYSMPGEPATHKGTTFDGRPLEVSVQPNIQTVMGTPEGKMLVPQSWKWSPLGSSETVSLVGADSENDFSPDDWAEREVDLEGEEEQEESAPQEAKVSHVIVRGDHDCFSFDGPAVSKLASHEKHNVTLDQAMFLLAGLGVDQAYGATKLAYSLNGPERVVTGREIIPAEEQERWAVERAKVAMAAMPVLKKDLMKEAAFIPDPSTVDTVLSLGFINPENVMTYVSYLPTIEDAQSKMCELLLAARVGLTDVPATALERAIRSTEESIEGLKVLAFQ